MRDQMELLYEIYIDGFNKGNLLGKAIIVIGLPLYIYFSICIIVIERIGPYIANVFLWFVDKCKK